jgi:predicted amino acid dehydrogenase
MVSKKGELFKSIFSNDNGFRVTTGHTATVYSLVSTAMQLVDKSEIERSKINIAILGCGNIGSHCAEFLLELGVQVTLIDVNQKKLRLLRKEFLHHVSKNRVHTALFTPKRIKRVLDSCHMGICATSNVGSIINLTQIPKHFIFIDDSRPEAIPRFTLEDKRYTLEGGLLSVHGLHSQFNFGFGNDHNTLGCLSESYLLAWDSLDTQVVHETVGRIDPKNYSLFSSFCELKGIKPGDYKMGDLVIPEERLVHAVLKRHIKINA